MNPLARLSFTLLAVLSASTMAGSADYEKRSAVAGEVIPQALAGKELKPLSLASTDFDGDGVADLAAGFATEDGGVVVLYRGNVDALYPHSPEARQRRESGGFVAEPFLSTDRVLVLSAPPDFLFAGDFDADGHADLAAAAAGGSSIDLLPGDGALRFGEPRITRIGGALTALGLGDLGVRDGLPDLVAAVAGAGGGRAVLLQNASGALSGGAFTIDLPHAATSIAVGSLASPSPRNRIALLGEDGRVVFLEKAPRRAWRRTEAETREQLDAAFEALAAAPANGLPADAAAILAMRVGSNAGGRVVLRADGSLSAFAAKTLSTYVVNSTADTNDATPGNNVCAAAGGECSLRAAIQEANAHVGADTITFAIPGGGVPQISTPSLPIATETITIDGTTQPAGRVMVTGTSNGHVITLAANDCVIRGIVLNGTGNNGLKIQGNDNVVEGNFFGTTADGSTSQGSFAGPNIYAVSGTGNLIGGTALAARNVIAGGSSGIYIDSGSTTVLGNYIGTDVTGTVDLGSLNQGVRAFTGDGNTIGGSAVGAGNLVSGHAAAGISLETENNLVQGNLVGTDASGLNAIPNDSYGIDVYFSADNTIGGTAPGAGNLISGNGSHGLGLEANAVVDTLVQGNRIGTNYPGTTALPNQGHGIQIVGGTGIVIGGSAPGAGNLISGNLQNGIFFTKFVTVWPTDTVVQGNLIGTDITGTVAVGNVSSGIKFEYARGTLLGGTGFGEGNTISGNQAHGIEMNGITEAAADPNATIGNLIGTNVYGSGALGNAQAGVYFSSNATGYYLGGTGAEMNRIAFNGGAGIASLAGRFVRFRPNVIHSNGGLGIDRGNNGVTPNQPPGTFVWENFPILTAATTSAAGTSVSGTLASGYATTFTIHVFANPSCDPTGYGEARQHLGATSVVTTAGAVTPFSANLPVSAPAGSYITAVAVAPEESYSGAASELSFCRQVTGDPGPPSSPPPLSLSLVVPAQGGNGGSVTVIVTGESIDPAASVRLERAGQADIPGEYLQVGAGGGNLRAIFNLTGAEPGVWDLVVTNPGPESATLPGGFLVEEGGESDVFANLIGRSQILRGRDTTFYIVFGNRGTVDAYGSQVILAGIPSDAVVTPLFDVSPIPHYDYLDPYDYSQIPLVAPGPEGQSLQLFLPVIPAGSTTVLGVRLKTSQPTFELRIGIGEPWFVTTDLGIGAALNPGAAHMSEETLNCLMTILKNVASEVLDLLLPEDCAGLVQEVMGNHLPNWFGNMLGAAQAEAGSTQAILSSTQASTQIVQIGTKGALCFAELLPAAKLFKLVMKLADIAAKGQAIAEIIDACKDLLPPWIRKPIESLIPSDPNDKIGSDGAGSERWVQGVDAAAYQILFENKPEATAPAHEVAVTDQLDITRFDLSTFAFGPVTFGDFVVAAPGKGAEFSTDVDMRPTRNVIVRVAGTLDTVAGLITWRFHSLDPATGFPSEDPQQGFLPPNTAPPAGEGAVSFSVELKEGLATGDEYRNDATIVFDLEAPIQTPEWLNTIDATPPASQVASLPGTSCSAIPLTWSGTDAHSGISSYDIFVSENGGAWQLWRAHTNVTGAAFEGTVGSAYAFYSIARDAAGNEESAPASADASTNAANPSPIVELLDPTSGLAGGGSSVELAGNGFLSGLTLSVGGTAATGVTVTDPQTAGATFPTLAPGALHDVTATNTGGCGWTFPKAWFADFLDVDQAHPFHRFVENILRKGITAGCATPGNYCPANPVTRAQMAVFLLKSKYGATYVPPPATGVFGDVPRFEPVRCVDRAARDGAHHGGLQQRQLLPEQPGDARPDGRLPAEVAVQPEPGAAPGHGSLRRRAGFEPVRALDRDARRGRDHGRLRRPELLPEQPRDARPDGGVPHEDLRLRAVARR